MSVVKSPQEKKELSYDRDHRSRGKYEQQFRKGWPRKKRRVTRASRRSSAMAAHQVTLDPDSPAVQSLPPKVPKTLKKRVVTTLRQEVTAKQKKRKARVGSRKARQAKNNPAV